jgi:iron complex outermembrane recepter protein
MNVAHKRAASWVHQQAIMFCAGAIALGLPSTRLLAADPEATSPSDQLQEVTVTAQRVEQNLQQVPIVVNALSGEQALQQGVTNVQSLVTQMPNVSFTTASNATNTYIRGVGDSSASPNNQPSTAFYVDGVYYAQAQALTTFNFNNIERIEVLEGPQGTLFGRNATAGVIQIITPDPKQELSGKIDAGYGNYDTYNAAGYVTGGLTERLSADVSVLYLDQIDGFGHDPNTGTPTYTERDTGVRSKWLYDLSDATKIRFVADYEDFDSGGTPDQYLPISSNLGPTTIPKANYAHGPYLGMYNAGGTPAYNDNLNYGFALTVDHNIGSLMHFQSISSYRWDSGAQALNSAVTPVIPFPEQLQELAQHFDGHYWTQEFHLTNLNPGRLTWLVGVFYYGDQVFGADDRISQGSLVSGKYQDIRGSEDTASGAVFGQATYDIIDQTRFTLGVRYTDETIKSFSSTRNLAGAITAGPYSGPAYNERDDPLTWRFALDHQFTSDILGYVSYNKGFKTGGYNLDTPGGTPYYGEHVDATELGLKSEFLDHRLRFNISGFYYHYRDMQVTVILGGAQLFTNAGQSQIFGLDGTLDFVATNHLTFAASVGLLNAKYLDFPRARGYTPAGAAINIPNASGADIPYAPPSSGSVSANYHDLMTPIGKFGATVALSYNDKSYITPDMGLERPVYFMLNGSIEWRPASDNSWAVRLWGKNLTDATTYEFASESATGWYVGYGAPRQYGITLEKTF